MEVDPFDRGVIFEQRRTPLKPGTTNSCNGKKEDFKKSLHALINRDRSEFLYKSKVLRSIVLLCFITRLYL